MVVIQVSDAVRLRVLWYHNFKVMKGSPFPAILVVDLLEWAKMRVDMSSGTYSLKLRPL